MSVELKTYSDNNKTYLAVGFIEDRTGTCMADEKPYKAYRADGDHEYFFNHSEALEFISVGLEPPKQNYTL